MLPTVLTAKAMQLCAAGFAATGAPAPAQYAIAVHTGAALERQPGNKADAEATVRDLISLGADFEAGPLAINGRDFTAFGVTLGSVFDACALAASDNRPRAPLAEGPATVSSVAALLRKAFGARITDTIRPMNAGYGVRYSWHKFGQAIDFVPAGGVSAVNRAQIRALMRANGVRLIELLGPGDRGHATHWHLAFARPGQVTDQIRPVEGDEDWVINVASADAPPLPFGTDAPGAPASVSRSAARVPPQWDVFAATEWRAVQGRGS